MKLAFRIAPLAVVGLALVSGPAWAAGAGSHLAAGTAGSHHAAPPKPVAVYVGRQLVASGQSLGKAIASVQKQVPFRIRTPRYTPKGYTPVQLAVTPQLRDVSGGFSTLSYALSSKGAVATANGFQIDQAARPIPYVGGTSVVTMTVGRYDATLHEFKATGHDILIITWVDGAGNGFDVVTDAAASRLSRSTLARIAASLS